MNRSSQGDHDATKSNAVPQLLERTHPRDRSRRLAYVNYTTPDGDRRQKSMGEAGTPLAERNYRDFLKAFLSGTPVSERPPEDDPDGPGVTVGTLAARFLRWADGYYVTDEGKPATEAKNFRVYVRPMNRLFADIPASAFGPQKLRQVRDLMIEDDLCRNEVNRRTRRIIQVFTWGVEHELVPPSVVQALRAVKMLRRGKHGVRESDPVVPVTWRNLRVLRHVSPTIAAMIRVMWLTGMRPGELCAMQMCDLDLSDEPWVFTPPRHKTAHRGKVLQKQLGPKVREILRPFLKVDPSAFLFNPADTDRVRGDVGDYYTTPSFRRAIARACRRAGLQPWSPNRLRHAFATRMRRRFGAERTQTLMGHAQLSTTLIYAEADLRTTRDIVEQVG